MTQLAHEVKLRQDGGGDDPVTAILDSLSRVRFGSINITLHEGRVVQLDITERRRLAR